MLQPSISLITVNYNSAHQIEKLYASLEKYAPKDFEFIVVDNNSSTSEIEKLEILGKNKSVHVIKLAENMGFGGGNWEGVQFAKGPFLGLINPKRTNESGHKSQASTM